MNLSKSCITSTSLFLDALGPLDVKASDESLRQENLLSTIIVYYGISWYIITYHGIYASKSWAHIPRHCSVALLGLTGSPNPTLLPPEPLVACAATRRNAHYDSGYAEILLMLLNCRAFYGAGIDGSGGAIHSHAVVSACLSNAPEERHIISNTSGAKTP